MSEQNKPEDVSAIAKAAWDEAWQLAFGDGLSAGHPLGHSSLDCDTEWADSEVVARIAKRAAHVPVGDPAALTDELQQTVDTLRHALEVIGVGDSQSPQSDAANALVEAGIWTAALLATQPAADARADKLLLPMPELIDRDGCVLELRFEEELQAEEFQRGLSLPAPAGKAFPENVEFAEPARADRQGVALSDEQIADMWNRSFGEVSGLRSRAIAFARVLLSARPVAPANRSTPIEEAASELNIHLPVEDQPTELGKRVRLFAEQLDKLRDHDVSSAFHRIIDAAKLIASPAAPLSESRQGVALSDEEITAVWLDCGGSLSGNNYHIFAHALLSRASSSRAEVESLRRTLAAIGVVGVIDGHDVIRRLSVLELVDRVLAAAEGNAE